MQPPPRTAEDERLLDIWIGEYKAAQRQKHAQFLKAIKHEFIERTAQQRRDSIDEYRRLDRLAHDLDHQAQSKRISRRAPNRLGKHRTATADRGAAPPPGR